MEFTYEALDSTGKPQAGVVNAANNEAAITSLQRKGLTITSLAATKEGGLSGLININLPFLGGVSNRDIVLLSRQIATLF